MRRFDPGPCGAACPANVVEVRDGDYVLHADHIAATLDLTRMLAEANAQCEEQRLRIAALDSANGNLVSRVHELEAELHTAAWAGGPAVDFSPGTSAG